MYDTGLVTPELQPTCREGGQGKQEGEDLRLKGNSVMLVVCAEKISKKTALVQLLAGVAVQTLRGPTSQRGSPTMAAAEGLQNAWVVGE